VRKLPGKPKKKKRKKEKVGKKKGKKDKGGENHCPTRELGEASNQDGRCRIFLNLNVAEELGGRVAKKEKKRAREIVQSSSNRIH